MTKTSLWFVCALLAMMAQTPAPTPREPFPGHAEPPKGWFCVPAMHERDVDTDAHACSCLGMTLDPMCGTETNPSTNDTAKCKVYCHKDHCTCMRVCEDSAARGIR